MKEIKRLLVLQHLEIEGPGLFEKFAKERDLKIEIIRLDNKNDLPQTKKGHTTLSAFANLLHPSLPTL